MLSAMVERSGGQDAERMKRELGASLQELLFTTAPAGVVYYINYHYYYYYYYYYY